MKPTSPQEKVIDARIINESDEAIHPPRLYSEQSLIGHQQRRIRDLEESIKGHLAKIKEKKEAITVCRLKIKDYERAESRGLKKVKPDPGFNTFA